MLLVLEEEFAVDGQRLVGRRRLEASGGGARTRRVVNLVHRGATLAVQAVLVLQ